MSAATDFGTRTSKMLEATRAWADALEDFLDEGGEFLLVDEISTNKGRRIKLSVEDFGGNEAIRLALAKSPSSVPTEEPSPEPG